MPFLKDQPDEKTVELVARIKTLATERDRIQQLFGIHDYIASLFDDVSSYGIFRRMDTLARQMSQANNSLKEKIDQLETIDPKHPLVQSYREKNKKVA